jgi:hypothetical protein
MDIVFASVLVWKSMIHELPIFLKWLISVAIVSFIGAIITRWVQYKPKVVCYMGQAAQFQIPSQDQNAKTNIMTHNLVLQNIGGKAATSVKLAHRFLPQITINGFVEYTQETLSDGTGLLIFPRLIPGEQVTVSYLYASGLVMDTIPFSLKHDDGFVKIINVLPMKVYPKIVNYSLLALIYIGALTILFFGYRLTLLILQLGCAA